MFIIPFTHTIKNEKNIKINIIKILTVAGKDLWEEESNLDIQSDILIPNGLYSLNKTPTFKLKGLDVYMCEIDTDKTHMSDFYNWNEIDMESDNFCWRTFYHITDLNNNIWLPVPDNEKISNFKIIDIINAILINSKK